MNDFSQCFRFPRFGRAYDYREILRVHIMSSPRAQYSRGLDVWMTTAKYHINMNGFFQSLECARMTIAKCHIHTNDFSQSLLFVRVARQYAASREVWTPPCHGFTHGTCRENDVRNSCPTSLFANRHPHLHPQQPIQHHQIQLQLQKRKPASTATMQIYYYEESSVRPATTTSTSAG